MNKLVTTLLFLCILSALNAQQNEKIMSIKSKNGQSQSQDSLKVDANKKENKKDKELKANIKDYLIISQNRDTTYVDTSLTIQKEYKFNYLRKDNFGLLRFSNLGQTYNSLTYNFSNTSLMPGFGARAKHFNYTEIGDVNYYRVPTPLTELFFKTAFEQGQLADSFFTINTSPQLNFSVEYKGLRSLGKYQNILASTGNFTFTTNYQTKNKKYNLRGHITMQDFLNQENGGIIDDNIDEFENADPEFLDRSIFEVNFENAESFLKGKRFHLEHDYKLIHKADSLSQNKLSFAHIMSFEDKFYQFDQTSADTDYFGESFVSTVQERATLENFYNQLQLNYSNNLLGDVQFNVSHNNYNYGYNKLIVLNGTTIINRLKGNIYAAGAKYNKQYKGFNLNGEAGVNFAGDFEGNFIKAQASFKIKNDISASASLNHSSQVPNYNTLLHQSDYINYNWQNNFSNIQTQQLSFNAKYKKLANLTVDYSTITDYVYFKEDETSQQVNPFQNSSTITYLRAKFENEITVGKFALNNTIMYQNVQDPNNSLNVPELNTRNTLYFSSHLFKKALYLQTGLTVNYFTKYYLNAYNPLLAEFYVQNETQYGNFPLVDFFLNAKIRQARIFFKTEHFNSSFTGYNYYSAPNYPYRDFIIRFGVVWNFFM
ncbi:putative porin [Tamlana sp. 62-3]|uniref:Porin n=1 Tax=Neotamlana sargassicola TaxID=2883125 RepID=A0A9X1IB25_9FLAO|nr:putative porin [Tamlana sargassicola]MCB4809664.1 putative porin [Tamlana sargassicola]